MLFLQQYLPTIIYQIFARILSNAIATRRCATPPKISIRFKFNCNLALDVGRGKLPPRRLTPRLPSRRKPTGALQPIEGLRSPGFIAVKPKLAGGIHNPPALSESPGLQIPPSPATVPKDEENRTTGGGMDTSGSAARSEAQRMLDAFTSVGAIRFTVTFTNLHEQETGCLKNRTVPSMRYNLTQWVERAGKRTPVTLSATEDFPQEETFLAGENLIIRPYTAPPALPPSIPPAVVLVQLDDLDTAQLERIGPAAFLTLATSPGNHQAWIAVEGGDRAFTSRLKRGTGADLSASGSVRMAGTGNYKRKYAPDFPTVAIAATHPGQKMTKGQLEAMGLAAPAPRMPEPDTFPLRCSDDPPRRKAWPDYQRCLEQGRESASGHVQRSVADFTWCCIAIDHFRREPEETAAELMRLSGKAKENGYDYALGQALRAAETVAAHPRSRSR